MNKQLKYLYSIINNKPDAKDKDRAFTFIEFIKEFNYDNSTSSFLNHYKLYLSEWATVKNSSNELSDKEFVRDSLIDTLKSIVLNYSSYEEQDYISNIDWNNELHKKAIVPFFAEKIKAICDFYKTKRQQAPLIVNKNNFKGSRKSLEQIIYDKIIDFYFENKNLVPQIEHLQNNLLISLEQYVDIYSDYFDIPRNRKCTDANRSKNIEVNINTADYRDYIDVSKVISDLLFNGEAYLEEIPLIAQVALDLNAKCVGDVATLRDKLLTNATINQITLSDQILLKRKLYEKYLGCDLYYIYCESKDNVYIDVLTKAENPSGNLLNGPSSDTAVVESDALELLSNIGLFFKPDKMGIIKVDARNFKWEIDKSKLLEDTFYIFPDPNRYGDIGNNKSADYPLVYEYKLSDSIKNLGGGYAKGEPMNFLGSTTWNTYYSKQDNDFILNNNKDFSYSFTSLANIGIITDYQVDIYGNEYGLFKGYTKDSDGNILVPSKFPLPSIKFEPGGDNDALLQKSKSILINGGYIEDPRSKGEKFDHDFYVRIAPDYIWTTVKLTPATINTPDIMTIPISAGNIADKQYISYVDHFGDIPTITSEIDKNKIDITNIVFKNFVTDLSTDTNIIVVDKSFDEINQEAGILYFKPLGQKPRKLLEDVNHYFTVNNILIIEKKNNIVFYYYDSASDEIKEIENIILDENQRYKALYNENDNSLYITILDFDIIENNIKSMDIKIYQYDIEKQKLLTMIDTSSDLDGSNYTIDKSNFNLLIPSTIIDNIVFSYNKELDLYLLVYLQKDNLNNPYIYQHKFRLYNKSRFYNTLESEVYYQINGAIYVLNPTIDSVYTDKEANSVYKPIKFFNKI